MEVLSSIFGLVVFCLLGVGMVIGWGICYMTFYKEIKRSK